MLKFEYVILAEAQKHPKHPFGDKMSKTIVKACIDKGFLVKTEDGLWSVTPLGLEKMEIVKKTI
jgi:hypothetical protein